MKELQREILKTTRISSVKEVAQMIGVSPPYLCRVISGQRPPSQKVLDFFGFERVVNYKRIEK